MRIWHFKLRNIRRYAAYLGHWTGQAHFNKNLQPVEADRIVGRRNFHNIWRKLDKTESRTVLTRTKTVFLHFNRQSHTYCEAEFACFTMFDVVKINYTCFKWYMNILNALLLVCTNKIVFTYFVICVNFHWI